MADFAQRQPEVGLRERLERAIHGTGAFHRFRDLIHDEHLTDQWHAFAADRQLGRAREFLAARGIRVGSQTVHDAPPIKPLVDEKAMCRSCRS